MWCSVCGDPCGNRTHVNGVRGRCLNRLTNGPFKREKRAGTYLFFRDVAIQVSSAQTSLTSVFGMGTGGSSSSSAPAVLRTAFATHSLYSLLFSRLHSHVPSKLNTEDSFRFANRTSSNISSKYLRQLFMKPCLGKCRT